jgi:hypothetical protein
MGGISKTWITSEQDAKTNGGSKERGSGFAAIYNPRVDNQST